VGLGFDGLEVVVLGEPVLDRYVEGNTERISREAPVLVVRETRRRVHLGGAANAAANLADLGAAVTLVGWVGDDPDGETLKTELRRAGITDRTVALPGRATPTKTRFVAGALQTRKQQMLRVDRGSRNPGPEGLDAVGTALASVWDRAAVLVVSDYGDGTGTERFAAWARKARSRGCTVVVDSRYALDAYPEVSAATPNQPEAEAALGQALSSVEAALSGAERLRDRLGLQGLVLTRGREGLVAVGAGGEQIHEPAVGGEAVDVTGAGDTVTAVVALAQAAGWSWTRTARAANLAAARVVRQFGPSTCPAADLQADLETAEAKPCPSSGWSDGRSR
jgi:D-glycero-beta-D-manno-heptose-7-phosphate kinase